jgi:chemotaxis protein MotB
VELSADRAHAARQILEEEGYLSANIYAAAVKAGTVPLFPGNPSVVANRRVTIILIREALPVSPNLQP